MRVWTYLCGWLLLGALMLATPLPALAQALPLAPTHHAALGLAGSSTAQDGGKGASEEEEEEEEEAPSTNRGSFLEEPIDEEGDTERGEVNPLGGCCLAGTCLTFTGGAGAVVGGAVGAGVGLIAGVGAGLWMASESDMGRSDDPASVTLIYVLGGMAGAGLGVLAGAGLGAGTGFLLGAGGGAVATTCALCGNDGTQAEEAEPPAPKKGASASRRAHAEGKRERGGEANRSPRRKTHRSGLLKRRGPRPKKKGTPMGCLYAFWSGAARETRTPKGRPTTTSR